MANDRRIMESGQTEVIEELVQTPEGYRVYLSTKTPTAIATARSSEFWVLLEILPSASRRRKNFKDIVMN